MFGRETFIVRIAEDAMAPHPACARCARSRAHRRRRQRDRHPRRGGVRRKHRVRIIAGSAGEVFPTRLHQCAPLLEETAPRAGGLGLVLDHMRERRHHDRVRRADPLCGVAAEGNRSVGPCSPGRSVIVNGQNARSSVVLAHRTKHRTSLLVIVPSGRAGPDSQGTSTRRSAQKSGALAHGTRDSPGQHHGPTERLRLLHGPTERLPRK